MTNVKQFASDKILKHLQEVQDWRDGKNPYAITTEIDPTNICNHKCPGCAGWLSNNKGKDSLSIEKLRDIINQIYLLGGKAVTFTGGGEPLLNYATIKAIDFAKERGLDVGLVCNGTLIKQRKPEHLIRNCTWIRISLDAGNPAMHRFTHGVNDYSLILKNIKLLVDIKERMKSNCTIGIAYLTGKGTDLYSDMMDFVDVGIELGVDYAQFRPYHTAALKDMHRFKVMDFTPFVRRSTNKTKILYSKHKYDCMAEGKLKPEYGLCFGHQFATVITATGDMTLCCHTRGLDEFTLGNIYKSTIFNIWYGDQRREVISKINVDKCPALCRANTFNYILWEINKEKEHVNFL